MEGFNAVLVKIRPDSFEGLDYGGLDSSCQAAA